MANGGTISLSYVVNNSEFNSKMADMKKNLQLLQTECKNAAKEINLYGANTQNLAKKQDTINQAIKQTEKIMAQYNQQLEKNKTALSSNQSELTKLAAKKKELTKQYKDAVKTYGEESQEAQRLKGELSQVSSEYDKMKGKVTTNKNNIQNYTAQLERQRSTLLDLQGQLKQTNEEIERQGNKFLQASGKFASAGKTLENAGGKISELGDQVQKAGAVIVTASTAMATLAANYESGLAKVNTLVGASKEEIESYGESVLQMSNNTGIAVGDATDALYDAISAGVSYGDSVQYINDVNKLAVGGFTDITNASNLMTQIFNIYGKTTADVTDISNKLFLVQKNGVTTVAQLATNMGEAMTMGASYNVSLENILSSYASLTKQGRTAATTQTQLKSMIQELGDTGSNVGKILQEKTGKSFTTLMKEGNSLYDVLKIIKDSCQGNEDAFNNLWSSTEAGLSAMSLLSNEGEFFNQTLEDMANSAGLTDEAFNTIADTTEYKMKKSLNELKNSFTKLGQSLLPFVDKASTGIEKLSKIIGNLSPEVVTAVAKFGLLAVAFGTGLKIVGSFTTVLGKGATALSTFFKIIANTKATGSFIKAISNSGTAVGGLVQSVSSAAGAIGSLGAAGAIGGAIVAVGALGIAFMKLQDNLNKNTSEFKRAADSFDDFSGRVRTNKNLFTEIFGEEIEIKFSDNFEEEVGKAKDAIQSLQDKWDEYYNNVNGMSEEQKTKDLQALESQMIADQRMLKEKLSGNLELFGDYLRKNTNMTELEIGNQQGYYTEFFDQKLKDYQDNENAIFEIKRNAINEGRELSALELQQIDELEQRNAEIVAALSGNTEDIMTSFKAWYESQRVVIEADKAQKEAYANSVIGAYQKLTQSIHDSFAQQEIDILNNKNLTAEQKQVAIDALHQREQAETDFTETFGGLMNEQIQLGKSNADASYSSMQKICEGLNNGTIDVEKYGMTASEYMAMAIGKMIEGGASADDLAAAIKAIPENKRADVLSKVSGKVETEELKRVIDSLTDKTVTVTTNYIAKYNNQGPGATMYETGGTVNESGVYTTQEAGLELIDTASPSQSAYSLANAARGELTYIPANSKVTNAAMTTLKMKSMIDEEMKSMFNLYMTELEKKLLSVMKGNSGNGDFNVTMNNPSFVDKGSENANINNIKRIIKSMK